MMQLRVPSTEYPDVAAALAAAPAGASVVLAAGVYRESMLRLERSISLVGAGAAVTVIESEAATAIACLGGSAHLSDLSVRQVICWLAPSVAVHFRHLALLTLASTRARRSGIMQTDQFTA